MQFDREKKISIEQKYYEYRYLDKILYLYTQLVVHSWSHENSQFLKSLISSVTQAQYSPHINLHYHLCMAT